MKAFNINCRIDDSLRDIIDLIKLRKGGLTEFIETKLREEIQRVPREEWLTLHNVRKLSGK